MTEWALTSFYRFTPLRDPEATKREILKRWNPLGLRALIILAPEGLNGTVAAPSKELRSQFQEWLKETFSPDMEFKDSHSSGNCPFRKLTIKIRPEIVTLKRPDLLPQGPHRHLKSHEWDQAIASGAILLDTRNLYESRIGSFKNAILPEIETFDEFPDAVRKMDLPKDQQILIFCTGGIRCEKAILALEEQGFSNVAQLEGGILKYLEEGSAPHWEGECFVFDHRVAVGKGLTPTETYRLCPLCGDPGDQPIECVNCGSEKLLCPTCATAPEPVCSKNCRHHRDLKKARRKLSATQPN